MIGLVDISRQDYSWLALSLSRQSKMLSMSTVTRKITLGHSPDSDDAFMFWGLASGAVQTPYEFEHILRDIQTLNEWAREGKLDTTAVSVHAFAYVADKYALLRHGGSFGEGYGPMLVSSEEISVDELPNIEIAVPGTLTSAFLQLNLYFEEKFGQDVKPKYRVVPFDEIIPTIQKGEARVGLIIHEGQLTYGEDGLRLIADMGVWWRDKTGLPLPLGVNVVRKDLGQEVILELNRCMRESIRLGLENRNNALDHALQYARGMDRGTSDQFVGMYVNDRTLDMGDDGVKAIKLLLSEGSRIGLVPDVEVAVVD